MYLHNNHNCKDNDNKTDTFVKAMTHYLTHCKTNIVCMPVSSVCRSSIFVLLLRLAVTAVQIEMIDAGNSSYRELTSPIIYYLPYSPKVTVYTPPSYISTMCEAAVCLSMSLTEANTKKSSSSPSTSLFWCVCLHLATLDTPRGWC